MLCCYESLISFYASLLALIADQDDFHNLPPKVKNFVGRDEELKKSVGALDVGSDNKLVIITGGLCCGKSSLAIQIGYEMSKNRYNYVVWINMRDITNANGPTLSDVALNVMQKFYMGTSETEYDIDTCLKRKLKSISDYDKSALLIFDNADELLKPVRDPSCKSTTFEKLWQLIGESSLSSVRAIFTSRVCGIRVEEEQHMLLKLEDLSEDDSRRFLSTEITKTFVSNRENLINDVEKVCQGLPYALKYICNEINAMGCEDMIREYISHLGEKQIDLLSIDERLNFLFDLSYKELKPEDKDAFKSLAFVPGGISYRYLMNFWKNLYGIAEGVNLLRNLEKQSLVRFYEDRYSVHPIICDFLKSRSTDDDTFAKYEKAYYTTYIKKLFALARKSLEMDSYAECLKIFHLEQHNFVKVMTTIGRGLENCPPYLITTVKELLSHSTADYICVSLFYPHEFYWVITMKFFEGCETFVEGQMKKNIWCCRYDINMSIYSKGINDDYTDLEPDDYGKALLDMRELSHIRNKYTLKDKFNDAIVKLDSCTACVSKLSDCKVQAVFLYELLKIRVCLSKTIYEFKELGINKSTLFENLYNALNNCKKSFGKHRLTIDCYTQLGEFFWLFKDLSNAKKWFEEALDLASSLSGKNSRTYLHCLIKMGSLLVNLGEHGSIDEGRRLLEDGLIQCTDASDEILWLLGLKSLVKVDRTKVDVIINHFVKEKTLFCPSLDAMHSAFYVALDHPNDEMTEDNFIDLERSTIQQLQVVIEHLENSCKEAESIDAEGQLLQDAKVKLYIFYLKVATTCMHVLDINDTKKYAAKALELVEWGKSIRGNRRRELMFIKTCDEDRYKLMQKKCHYDQIVKRIPSIQNQVDNQWAELLKSCEKYSNVRSLVVEAMTRNRRDDVVKVAEYQQTRSQARQDDSIDEGRRCTEDELKQCTDAADETDWLFGLQSPVKVDRTKVGVIINHFVKEKTLFRPSLDVMHSAFCVALDQPITGMTEDNFIELERSTVQQLQIVIEHLENSCKEAESIDAEGQLLQDAKVKLYIFYLKVATTCMHVLDINDTKKYAAKALELVERGRSIRDNRRRELMFIKTCDEDRYKLMQKKCHYDQIVNKIPLIQNHVEDQWVELLKSCEKYSEVWSWIVRALARNRRVHFMKVTQYLQTLPGKTRRLPKVMKMARGMYLTNYTLVS